MSTYAVTFRIANKTVGGRTYQQRYDALNDELKKCPGGLWFDTTSFYLVGTDENTFEFGNRMTAGLNSSCDMFAAFDPEDMSACYFGDLQAPEIFEKFFRTAKRLK